MGIVTTSIIGLLLAVMETSFLPFFRIFGALPFIFLAFITFLAVRYRGYFHFFLAFFAGVYFDYITGSVPGLFTAVYVSSVIIGRALFYRDTGYDDEKSYFLLLSGSSAVIYLVQTPQLVARHFLGWQTFVFKSVLGIFLTLLSGFIIYKLFGKYTDWLNKISEEKYR